MAGSWATAVTMVATSITYWVGSPPAGRMWTSGWTRVAMAAACSGMAEMGFSSAAAWNRTPWSPPQRWQHFSTARTTTAALSAWAPRVAAGTLGAHSKPHTRVKNAIATTSTCGEASPSTSCSTPATAPERASSSAAPLNPTNAVHRHSAADRTPASASRSMGVTMVAAVGLRMNCCAHVKLTCPTSFRTASSSPARSGRGSPHSAARARSTCCFTCGSTTRHASSVSADTRAPAPEPTWRTDTASSKHRWMTVEAERASRCGGSDDTMKCANLATQSCLTRSARWAWDSDSDTSDATALARMSSVRDSSKPASMPARPDAEMASAASASLPNSPTSSAAWPCSASGAPVSKPLAAVAKPPALMTAARPSRPPRRATLAMMNRQSLCAASSASARIAPTTLATAPGRTSSAVTPASDDVSMHSRRTATAVSSGVPVVSSAARLPTPSLPMNSSRYPAISTTLGGSALPGMASAEASDCAPASTTGYMGAVDGAGPRGAVSSMRSDRNPPAARNFLTRCGESVSSICTLLTTARCRSVLSAVSVSTNTWCSSPANTASFSGTLLVLHSASRQRAAATGRATSPVKRMVRSSVGTSPSPGTRMSLMYRAVSKELTMTQAVMAAMASHAAAASPRSDLPLIRATAAARKLSIFWPWCANRCWNRMAGYAYFSP